MFFYTMEHDRKKVQKQQEERYKRFTEMMKKKEKK